MKIISKYKDYYDYLQGVNGIDEKVCYDRRNAVNIDCTKWDSGAFKPWFDPTFKGQRCRWNWENKFFVGLEVGYQRYVFSIFRGEDYDRHEYKLEEKKRIEKSERVSEAPINLYEMERRFGYGIVGQRYIRTADLEYVPVPKVNKDGSGIHENPILSKTFIPSLVPAEEVWENLYEYISSLNDVDFSDGRTDVQKVESHGFDKKTSFRNM